jgi:hypothetical protein
VSAWLAIVELSPVLLLLPFMLRSPAPWLIGKVR